MKPRGSQTSFQDKRVELWTPWGVLRLSGSERADRERREKERRERLSDTWVRPPASPAQVSPAQDWDGEPLG